MERLMTPSGELRVTMNDDPDFPGVNIFLGEEKVAMVEWTSDDGIRTVAYQIEEDEPIAIIDFGI